MFTVLTIIASMNIAFPDRIDNSQFYYRTPWVQNCAFDPRCNVEKAEVGLGISTAGFVAVLVGAGILAAAMPTDFHPNKVAVYSGLGVGGLGICAIGVGTLIYMGRYE